MSLPFSCCRRRRCRCKPTTVVTAAAVDPIYAAIHAHRQAVAAHDAVTDVRAAFNDVNMNGEKTQLDVLEAAVDDAWDRLDEAGCDLVNSEPTTLAGVVALYPRAHRRLSWPSLKM